MLNLYFYTEEDTYDASKLINGVDQIFKFKFKQDWLSDKLVQKIILDVGNDEVRENQLIYSRHFERYIAPTELSTGVKGLLLMLKEDTLDNRIYASDKYDENCFKWIFEISKIKDVTLLVSSWFYPPLEIRNDRDYEVNLVSEGMKLFDLWETMLKIQDHILQDFSEDKD